MTILKQEKDENERNYWLSHKVIFWANPRSKSLSIHLAFLLLFMDLMFALLHRKRVCYQSQLSNCTKEDDDKWTKTRNNKKREM
jgi:hypothetical protein